MIVRNAILYLFLALVVLSPMPFGGNNPLAWAVNGVGVAFLLTAFSLVGLATGERLAVPFRKVAVPFVLFLLVCVWGYVQTLSITPESLHHPIWRAASEVLGRDLGGSISANPYESKMALLRLMTYGGVFWLALQFGRDRNTAGIMLNVVVFAIAVYAVYGLALWAAGSETILGYDKKDIANAQRLSSTFIGSNNFATFAGVGVIAFLALFLRSMRGVLYNQNGEPFKYRVESVIAKFAGVSSLYFLGFLVTFGALLLSKSRAGFIFTVMAVVTLLIIGFARTRARSSAGQGGFGLVGIVIAVGLAIGTFAVFVDFAGEGIAKRFEQGQLSDARRTIVFPRVIDAISDFPIVGTGFGSFPDVFTMYRDESLLETGRWDKAHNTYLENMMELGLPAAGALFLAVGRCIV